MGATADNFIREARAYYSKIVEDNSARFWGGNRLIEQFESAVKAFKNLGIEYFSGVLERTNELCVAELLLEDAKLALYRLEYEPRISATESKIDFVVRGLEYGNLYLEVKTVRPTGSPDQGWQKYETRRKRFPADATFLVEKEWLGDELYADAFKARSKFLEYSLEFENRLADACLIEAGRGVLVFCLSGTQWSVDQLEDFSDFYLTGRHRPDDSFGPMEANHIGTEGIKLKRNIASFGFIDRPWNELHAKRVHPDVRGPRGVIFDN